MLSLLPKRPQNTPNPVFQKLLTRMAWDLSLFDVPCSWPKPRPLLRGPGKGTSQQEKKDYARLLKIKPCTKKECQLSDEDFNRRDIARWKGAGRPQTETHRDSFLYCLSINLKGCGYKNHLGLIESIWKIFFPSSASLSRRAIFDILKRQAKREAEGKDWKTRVLASRQATSDVERRQKAKLAQIAKDSGLQLKSLLESLGIQNPPASPKD